MTNYNDFSECSLIKDEDHSMAKIEMRRRILQNILCDTSDSLSKSLYDDIYAFYKNIFRGVSDFDAPGSEPTAPDLVICMARKSWCLLHAFLPLFSAQEKLDTERVIHDKMLTPWFNMKHDKKPCELKVSVLDDTYLTGRALDDCIRRLVYCYGVLPQNITFYTYAMLDLDENKKKFGENRGNVKGSSYYVRGLVGKGGDFWIGWGGSVSTTLPEKTIRAYSQKFVEAIHACGEPYMAYMPAFLLSFSEAQTILGSLSSKKGGYMEQSDLENIFAEPKKFEYHNITTQQMYHWNVEAFTLSPICNISGITFDWLPTDNDALSFSSLRFYVNRKMKTVLFAPYVSLKACKAVADLSATFPDDIQPLLVENPSAKWTDSEGQLAAHRILRYAISYAWGKSVLASHFGITDAINRIASNGGLCSQNFFEWIDNENRIYVDLKNIWEFFTISEHIEETLPFEDENMYNEAFSKIFSEKPVDYYMSSFALFRTLVEKERQENKPVAFRGIPLKVFAQKIQDLYGASKDMVAATIFLLCDVGAATTYVCQRKGVIGTYIVNGEQSCQVIYNACPSYAFFLTRLMEILKEDLCLSNQIPNFKDDLTNEVRKHFQKKIDDGYHFGFTVEQLLNPLKDVLNKENIPPYCSLPYPDIYDSSTEDFDKLLQEFAPSRAENLV